MTVTTSAVPAVIDALVALARSSLPGHTVYDGVGVSDDAGDYLMVGVDDPDARQRTSAASSQQQWANVGKRARDEAGDITCASLSYSGDTDQKAVRDAAYATVEAFGAAVRTNPALGIDVVEWTSFGTSTELQQIQDKNGAMAIVIFHIAFQARI